MSKPGGITPTIVKGLPSMSSDVPTTSADSPRAVRQSSWLSTTTLGETWSSGSSTRPSSGSTPTTSNALETTATPLTRCGSDRLVRVNEPGRSTAICSKTRFRSRQSTKSGPEDRKSTRLNSSHSQISYAVFCLKKKKKKITTKPTSQHTN